MPKPNRPPVSTVPQLIIGFVIPTVILMALSDESKLGPLVAMGLALLFPVALEIYSFFTGRKASFISLLAIIGILLIGIISLFGLSEEWLGVRRAGIYAVGAIVVGLILLFKQTWIDKGLNRLMDMSKVRSAAQKNKSEVELMKLVNRTGWMLVVLLVLTAIWSYVLTLLAISAPTGSSAFNAEYAQLRLISIPLVSLPLLIAATSLLVYLALKIEKLTGIDVETLLQKKRKD